MKIYIVSKEYYEEQYVLGIYDDKNKAEKIAQQFEILEKYIDENRYYKIITREYELNALQEGVAENILGSLENIKKSFGIPQEVKKWKITNS